MSDFQDELINDDGYENIVIIAIGQSNISGFNNNFCANSDLPLVMDAYPSLPIRAQFSPYGQHKQIVILGYEGEFLGTITLNSGLSVGAKNYIRNIIEENYQDENILLGDLNYDTTLNIQDIILLINFILVGGESDASDMNDDGITNILDVIQLINIILLP